MREFAKKKKQNPNKMVAAEFFMLNTYIFLKGDALNELARGSSLIFTSDAAIIFSLLFVGIFSKLHITAAVSLRDLSVPLLREAESLCTLSADNIFWVESEGAGGGVFLCLSSVVGTFIDSSSAHIFGILPRFLKDECSSFADWGAFLSLGNLMSERAPTGKE